MGQETIFLKETKTPNSDKIGNSYYTPYETHPPHSNLIIVISVDVIKHIEMEYLILGSCAEWNKSNSRGKKKTFKRFA